MNAERVSALAAELSEKADNLNTCRSNFYYHERLVESYRYDILSLEEEIDELKAQIEEALNEED